jgi:nucleoside-diphosphate-sugar epimerase
VEWTEWDATGRELPAVPFKALDAIAHLAAPTELKSFPDHASEHFDAGVLATFHLLEAARGAGVPHFLLASTGDVLGRGAPAPETDTDYAPSGFYGTAKACAELLTRAYSDWLCTTILRFYHPYGPGGERHLVNRLVRCVAEAREVTVEGPDGILLNPVWVTDLAIGVRQALEAGAAGTFHLAGPDVLSLRALLETAGELTGREPLVRTVDREPVQRHAGSWEGARAAFGYEPRVGIREGIRRLLASA